MRRMFDVMKDRRPSLMPLLGATISGKRHRWLKVSGLAALTFICLLSMHVLFDPNTAALLDIGIVDARLNISTMISLETSQGSANESEMETTTVYEPVPPETCESIKSRADNSPDIEFRYPADLASDVVLEGWEDDWIAHGIVKNDSQIKPYKADFVYTYVRSDEDFLAMKQPYDVLNSKAKDLKWQILQASRFRSWDELRYSIRGSLKNAASWIARINIVAKDFDRFDAAKNQSVHVLQSPLWLNESVLIESPGMAIIPESTILNTGDCGPTFNSVSIESSFGNIPLTTEHFVGLSDDMFLGKETSASDFVSPLFGMCFSWYKNIWALDEDKEPDLSDGELGEGHTVRHTSYWLNQRFGRRRRSLQLHHAKIVNQKIFNEALATFPKSAIRTPLSRWRDDSQQLYSWYLHMHFTMEMHREALLWAIAMRIDQNDDKALQASERAAFLEEIEEGIRGNGRRHVMPMLQQAQQKFEAAELESFKVQRLDHTSLDGPQQIKDLTFEHCNDVFSVDKCFGPEFSDMNAHQSISANSIFDRLVSPGLGVECGDCLIKYLLNNADIGLSPLLPRPGSKYREQAIKAIHKYQYTETSPENTFLMIRDAAEAGALPGYAERATGLMCINDDIITMDPQQLSTIASGYRGLFERLFPDPSIYEQVEASSEFVAEPIPQLQESAIPAQIGG